VDEQILVQLSGQDQPGLTASLMELLASARAEVLDVEQIAIRQRLHLSVLITVPADRDLFKELLLFGWERGVQIEFEVVSTDAGDGSAPLGGTRHGPTFAVTLLAPTITARQLQAAAQAVAAGGGNIERITCLARYPVRSYELLVSAPALEPIRSGLLAASRAERFDVAVQRDGLSRRAMRLVAVDVDSTLIQDEVIDLLAAEAGCQERVRAITERAMAGELDFEGALRERVALLAGLDVSIVEQARARVRLTPGARTFVRTLKRLGYKLALVSGGFTLFTDHLRRELGVDYAFANHLEVVDGRLTGRVDGPVVDRRRKAELLAEVAAAEGIDLAQTVAIGDGANDLDMLARAGLGIAFNAKPVVRDAADTAVSVPYLDAVLFVLGIRRDDVVDADTADGLEVVEVALSVGAPATTGRTPLRPASDAG
jgi:phosphoserine phosphatase